MLLRKDCPTSSEIKPKGPARSASARRSAVSHQNGVPSEYVWKASSSCLLLYRQELTSQRQRPPPRERLRVRTSLPHRVLSQTSRVFDRWQHSGCRICLPLLVTSF